MSNKARINWGREEVLLWGYFNGKIIQKKKTDEPVAELKGETRNGVNLRIVVSRSGLVEEFPGTRWSKWIYGVNVKLSMNGTAYFNFEDFAVLNEVVQEAARKLAELEWE